MVEFNEKMIDPRIRKGEYFIELSDNLYDKFVKKLNSSYIITNPAKTKGSIRNSNTLHHGTILEIERERKNYKIIPPINSTADSLLEAEKILDIAREIKGN